jgi:hypothetical protein
MVLWKERKLKLLYLGLVRSLRYCTRIVSAKARRKCQREPLWDFVRRADGWGTVLTGG